jgi:hypothetical protein
MRRIIPSAVVVLASLLLPAVARAHGQLPIARGHRAIARYLGAGATIGHCWSMSATVVSCRVEQEYEGDTIKWTFSATRRGQRVYVAPPPAFEDPQPYSERF